MAEYLPIGGKTYAICERKRFARAHHKDPAFVAYVHAAIRLCCEDDPSVFCCDNCGQLDWEYALCPTHNICEDCCLHYVDECKISARV